ncbi:MAG: ABC transporter substrate-binding protein [Rhodospirillales bacterium]|jgi:phospholipid transport system substrate-binding protein|nr:ABC transporter substrate-binding protein [Rhodospirillales bacterium]MBT4039901.1 ABC transporter substrate-binding protein [Rhodospirillales bacterium]MBT4627280.1 ABC transporter substrate-binding protein [Rhodospirillales bacterium]MBT5351243.1 ABC transporter substrate-binding protein [Rhodospirillales bacterium]MBT5520080.1 ABC transporter substrate-binding protein [Rhodospirillales bacterium]
MIKAVVTSWIFVTVLWVSPLSAHAAEEVAPPAEAARFVTALGEQAIKVLSDQSIPLEQREEQVRQLLSRNFALDKIGRFVLGRAWKKATEAQQSEYLQLFSKYVLTTYSRRLGGYAGEELEIVKAQPMGKRDAVVLSKVHRADAAPLNCGWRVRLDENRFQIMDIIVEGVSMISVQRSEFAAVVKNQGVDGLIESLRMQVSKYTAQAS